MPTIDQVLCHLEQRFNPEAAQHLNEVFEFQLTDSKTFHLIINQGKCELVHGEHEDPNVTLIMDTDTFIGITTGEMGGMQAFMSGKLRAEGNMMLATKLGELFSM